MSRQNTFNNTLAVAAMSVVVGACSAEEQTDDAQDEHVSSAAQVATQQSLPRPVRFAPLGFTCDQTNSKMTANPDGSLRFETTGLNESSGPGGSDLNYSCSFTAIYDKVPEGYNLIVESATVHSAGTPGVSADLSLHSRGLSHAAEPITVEIGADGSATNVVPFPPPAEPITCIDPSLVGVHVDVSTILDFANGAEQKFGIPKIDNVKLALRPCVPFKFE